MKTYLTSLMMILTSILSAQSSDTLFRLDNKEKPVVESNLEEDNIATKNTSLSVKDMCEFLIKTLKDEFVVNMSKKEQKKEFTENEIIITESVIIQQKKIIVLKITKEFKN